MSKLQEYLLEFPGVTFNQFPARIYPSDIQLSHVLGYVREVTKRKRGRAPGRMSLNKEVKYK